MDEDVLAGVDVGRLLAVDLLGRTELRARVLGVAVDLGFAVVGRERALHLDAEIEGRGRLREREGAFFGEDRLVLSRGTLPVDGGDEAISGWLDCRDHLVALDHVPAVVGLAVDRDLHEADHDATVMGVLEARALGETQGAAGVVDVEVRLIRLQPLGRGAHVVGRHEAGDDLAVLGDVDGLVRGDLDVGGEGLGEGQQGAKGEGEGAHGLTLGGCPWEGISDSQWKLYLCPGVA